MTLPMNTRLVLASASPRRLDLLAQIGIVPDIVEAAEIDETPFDRELPRQHATRLAKEKARKVSEKFADDWVIGADTVVACGHRILPKTEDVDTAAQCLKLLSGRAHRVYGGVAVNLPDNRVRKRLVVTHVKFKRLSADELSAYLESGEWHGKAGGYAVQGKAAAFVANINGSYSNVVGLPLYETAALLAEFTAR